MSTVFDSRSLHDLHPAVASKAYMHIARCERELGIKVLVTCTLRSTESQNALYKQGRETPGKIVTWVRGGDSFHNWGLAYDIAPVRNGHIVWDASDEVWQEMGRIGEELGLEWGGRWNTPDMPHFQYTQGLTTAQLKAGAELNHAVV